MVACILSIAANTFEYNTPCGEQGVPAPSKPHLSFGADAFACDHLAVRTGSICAMLEAVESPDSNFHAKHSGPRYMDRTA